MNEKKPPQDQPPLGANQRRLNQEREAYGIELAQRIRRAKAYELELQRYWVWSLKREALGLSTSSRYMKPAVDDWLMRELLRCAKYNSPILNVNSPSHYTHPPPRLDPYKYHSLNPNEIYYVGPGGCVNYTLGQLHNIGRVMSDNEWTKIACLDQNSPMEVAFRMGSAGGPGNSFKYLLEYLNQNTRYGHPDYAAACMDMYFGGNAFTEGIMTLGFVIGMQNMVKATPIKEYAAEGRTYTTDTIGRYTPKPTGTFSNRCPGDDVSVPLQKFSPSQVRSPNFSRKVNYVIKEDGELVLGRKSNAVGGGHIDLAGGKPVQAAGEAFFEKGQLRYIDNSSGHYLPSGSIAKDAAINAFKKAGLGGQDLYVEKVWNGSAWVKK